MKPSERFTNRVENYHLYRPSYAKDLIDYLEDEKKVLTEKQIAEIGSGTGILSNQLLKAGWQIFGIEPNEAMRLMAENQLKDYPGFVSIHGSAEATTLDNNSINMIIAGQAFHWFEPDASRKEFLRILKPEGKVVLVWNIRQHATPFLKAYEEFLHQYSTDYKQVDHQRFDWQGVAHFYGERYQRIEAANPQYMDWQQLWGYYQSCSYALTAQHPEFASCKSALQHIFDTHAQQEKINMLYHTVWYIGKL